MQASLSSRDSDDATSSEDAIADRLASRLGSDEAPVDEDRPLERLAERLGDADEPAEEASLLSRLAEYGISAETHAYDPSTIAHVRSGNREGGELLVTPRLYGLESVRYLLLLALTATAATAAWILSRSVGVSGDLVGGDINDVDVDRIDLARRTMVAVAGVALALVPLWCAMVAVKARRAGAPETYYQRSLVLFGLAAALNVASLLLDGSTRSTISLLSLLGLVVIVAVSTASVTPVLRWYERSTVSLTIWSLGLAVMLALSWIGGLQRPIGPSASLEALSFFAALQAIVTGIVVVVAALTTADVEEAIRLSPELAEPLRRRRRRGRTNGRRSDASDTPAG